MIIQAKPVSKSGHWLFGLEINGKKGYVHITLHKLWLIYGLAMSGNLKAIITLFLWCGEIHKCSRGYDKAMRMLDEKIRASLKSPIAYVPHARQGYRLAVANPLQADFYRLAIKFDLLMYRLELARLTGILKPRSVKEKGSRYEKGINRVEPALTGRSSHTTVRAMSHTAVSDLY